MSYDVWKLSNPDDERWQDPADQCPECGDHYMRCSCDSDTEVSPPDRALFDAVETCQGCGDSAVGLGIDANELCGACRDNDAAMSCDGDENDMTTAEQMNGDPGFPWESKLALLLDGATDLQLKQARYAIEREEKRRLEAAQATIRALDPNAPKPRATRRDKGTTRAQKPANEVLRDKEGVAV